MPFNPDIPQSKRVDTESSESEVSFEGEKLEYAPEGWMTNGAIAKNVGVDFGTIKRAVENYKKNNPEWFDEFQYRGEKRLYYHPELIAIVRRQVAENFERVSKG